MTKARDFADIAGAVSGGKIASADVNVSFENISDTGTTGTKVATGTTAQRGSTAGQFRLNTTTGNFEGRDSSGNFRTIEATPTVSSVDVTEIASDTAGNVTIVVTGTNFSSGGTVSFVGTSATFNASTTTYNSATQVTVTAPYASFLNAQEPYKVRFTAPSGVAGMSGSGLINVDNAPAFTVAAGSLGSLHDSNRAGSQLTAVAATDSEGDAITFAIQSGSIPAGLTFNSNGTFSGTANQVGSDTTSNFTVRASAGGKTSDRAYSATVQKPPVYMSATGGAITTDGDYRIHTFKNDAAGGNAWDNYTSAFVVQWTGTDSTYGDKVWYLLVGGGGMSERNGGGGAGGLLTNGATATYDKTVTAQSYSLTVGGGGGTSTGYLGSGTGDNSDGQGGDSTLFGLTALGGGLGGQNGGSLGNGGSGGGGASDYQVTAGSGTSGQGNNGGAGRDPHPESAGGGGGAGSAGTTPGNSGYGHGGDGLQNAITGTNIYYAGGGGGHGMFSNPGNGGQGGGADAGNNASYSSGDSAENYLGGGGASKTSIEGGATLTAQYSKNRNGGSGVIIVRYKYQ